MNSEGVICHSVALQCPLRIIYVLFLIRMSKRSSAILFYKVHCGEFLVRLFHFITKYTICTLIVLEMESYTFEVFI